MTDQIAYRVEVQKMLESDVAKHPAVNELIGLARGEGVDGMIMLAITLAGLMDICFRDNVPADECARRIEEAAAKTKELADAALLDGAEITKYH